MAKVVSEGQKAKKLLELTKGDVGENAYRFLKWTVRYHYERGTLAMLTEKQHDWCASLYDKHFGEVGGNDGN